MNNLKLVLKHKLRGQGIHILIISLLFFALFAVLSIWAISINQVNTVETQVDDALTTALLGAGVINTAELGQSGRLVIADTTPETSLAPASFAYEQGIDFGDELVANGYPSDALEQGIHPMYVTTYQSLFSNKNDGYLCYRLLNYDEFESLFPELDYGEGGVNLAPGFSTEVDPYWQYSTGSVSETRVYNENVATNRKETTITPIGKSNIKLKFGTYELIVPYTYSQTDTTSDSYILNSLKNFKTILCDDIGLEDDMSANRFSNFIIGHDDNGVYTGPGKIKVNEFSIFQVFEDYSFGMRKIIDPIYGSTGSGSSGVLTNDHEYLLPINTRIVKSKYTINDKGQFELKSVTVYPVNAVVTTMDDKPFSVSNNSFSWSDFIVDYMNNYSNYERSLEPGEQFVTHSTVYADIQYDIKVLPFTKFAFGTDSEANEYSPEHGVTTGDGRGLFVNTIRVKRSIDIAGKYNDEKESYKIMTGKDIPNSLTDIDDLFASRPS